MRYAVIKDNLVTNVIEVDRPSDFPSMILVRTDVAGIGWLYDPQTGNFARPADNPAPAIRSIPKTQWKMRIPVQKYASLRALSMQDDVVWAFLDILNDPTLLEVDLDSAYLTGALDYLIITYPNLVSASDKAIWLS